MCCSGYTPTRKEGFYATLQAFPHFYHTYDTPPPSPPGCHPTLRIPHLRVLLLQRTFLLAHALRLPALLLAADTVPAHGYTLHHARGLPGYRFLLHHWFAGGSAFGWPLPVAAILTKERLVCTRALLDRLLICSAHPHYPTSSADGQRDWAGNVTFAVPTLCFNDLALDVAYALGLRLALAR